MSKNVRTGRCLCGQVTYEVIGPLRPVVGCHCGQCRRQTGHWYAATQAPMEALSVTAGSEAIRWYEASAEARRGFCGTCGSALFWQPTEGQHIGILAGTLDSPTGLELAGHIFTADKGDYYEIGDGLPTRPQGGAAEVVEEALAAGKLHPPS